MLYDYSSEDSSEPVSEHSEPASEYFVDEFLSSTSSHSSSGSNFNLFFTHSIVIPSLKAGS